MDIGHCEESVVRLADILAEAYPLGRPPGECFDEAQRLARLIAVDYVAMIGGSNADVEDILAKMMRKFHHRYAWLTDTMSARALSRAEPMGTA